MAPTTEPGRDQATAPYQATVEDETDSDSGVKNGKPTPGNDPIDTSAAESTKRVPTRLQTLLEEKILWASFVKPLVCPKYPRYLDLQTTFLEGRNSMEHMTPLCRAGYFRRQIAEPTYLSSFLSFFGYASQHAEPTMQEWLSRPIKDLFGGLDDVFDKSRSERGPIRAVLCYLYGVNPFLEIQESYKGTHVARQVLVQCVLAQEAAMRFDVPGLLVMALNFAIDWLEGAFDEGDTGIWILCSETDMIYYGMSEPHEGTLALIKMVIVAACHKHIARLVGEKLFSGKLVKDNPELLRDIRVKMIKEGDVSGLLCLKDL